jgi:protein gp37
MGLPVWGPPSTTARKRTSTENWKLPARWHRAALRAGVRRRVFVASLADVFEDHPDLVPWRAEALAILAQCTALDVQLLTKRPENVVRMVPPAWLEHWPQHVWIGCTVEDQRRADERIPELLKVPAEVRFLSCEPLLEEVSLDLRPRSSWGGCRGGCVQDDEGLSLDGAMRCMRCGYPTTTFEPGVSWVIVGGESGPGARHFDLSWARSLVGQCREAGVPVFFKQLGDNPLTSPGPITWPTTAHHGADPSEWPADLRVQEFPR